MEIKFGDLSREYQQIHGEIDEAIGRVLSRGWFVLGDELKKFEDGFARYLGIQHCVGVANGTEAIALALKACGVGLHDEVLTVSHTATPTVSAISMIGAKPVFVDIDPKTMLMDVGQVERSLTSKTRAVVPVHLYGQCVDMDPLLEISKRHHLFVVEDCAQATGATYQERPAGTMGHLGAFSFYPCKNLGCYGDGGAITTGDTNLADRLRMLRNYGQRKRYHNEIVGYNSRLDEIQAAVLNVKLHYLDLWNERRRQIAKRYNEGLAHLVLETPAEAEGNRHVYHLYAIRVKSRDGLQKYLREKGVETLIHYRVPVHLQQAYAELEYPKGCFPITESVAREVLSLPLYVQLGNEEVQYVISTLKSYQG
ncbi:MAG: DegT/DnrJ/EryC1/StrS family aminotransferase [Candidatus Omnitrophica bacterium]|nr:DegT/DnrJ/EryC1/StrS family aminotransferase [Candidatus Omnitrophota bacterium]MDD5670024.1 DegT/DnrJ/EryC1/StrS family aminotransferase [Candidatus Omnitrophota bacterium]